MNASALPRVARSIVTIVPPLAVEEPRRGGRKSG